VQFPALPKATAAIRRAGDSTTASFAAPRPCGGGGSYYDRSWANPGGEIGPDRPEGKTGVRYNARQNRHWPGILRALARGRAGSPGSIAGAVAARYRCLIWWLAGDPSLSTDAKAAIIDPGNEIFVSAVSAWEIATKYRIGRLPQQQHSLWTSPVCSQSRGSLSAAAKRPKLVVRRNSVLSRSAGFDHLDNSPSRTQIYDHTDHFSRLSPSSISVGRFVHLLSNSAARRALGRLLSYSMRAPVASSSCSSMLPAFE
jgi:hypothetical protein